MKRKERCWGVIAYGGSLDDPAKFDGWYFVETWAHEARKYWQEQLPGWSVHVVEHCTNESPKM